MTAHEHAQQPHRHGHGEAEDVDYFEPATWDERYSAAEQVWSGNVNPQLVALASTLTPGTALDVGCGEGGDVLWLAQQGWRTTGADFSARGLARAAEHAATAGVTELVDWWQVDARTFDAGGRTFDLVTSHYLHPPDGGLVAVVGRLATAVAPGGHLLVVGHAYSHVFTGITDSRRGAMLAAEELVPGLPDGFEVLAAENRPRTLARDGQPVDVEDATLIARRAG